MRTHRRCSLREASGEADLLDDGAEGWRADGQKQEVALDGSLDDVGDLRGDAVEGLQADDDGEFDPGHEFNSLGQVKQLLFVHRRRVSPVALRAKGRRRKVKTNGGAAPRQTRR